MNDMTETMVTNEAGGRWRLATIRVRDFRGVAGEQVFALDGHPVLFTGRNGTGKSTVALALQWALFGDFPDGILTRTNFDTHLLPVGTKAKTYEVEVVFRRGDEALRVTRRRATAKLSQLEVEIGGASFSENEAQSALERALGLDFQTFVRTTLLLQSRVRGLLLDNPKERNAAMDRFLGMDAAAGLLDVVSPKSFYEGAEELRAGLKEEKQKIAARKTLLGEQLESARERARSLGFRNPDLNGPGLRKELVRVVGLAGELARRHGTTIGEVSVGEDPAAAARSVAAIRQELASIRAAAGIGRELAALETRRAALESLKERFTKASEAASAAQGALDARVREHGDAAALAARLATANDVVTKAEAERKTADEMAALLGDALGIVDSTQPNACPVCEQAVEASRLGERLRERVEAVSGDAIREKEAALSKAKETVKTIEALAAGLTRAEKAVEEAKTDVEKVRKGIMTVLDAGVREDKALVRLDEAIARSVAHEQALRQRVEALDREIAAVENEVGRITEGLLPALARRIDLDACEKREKEIEAAHATTETRAVDLERTGAAVEQIRQALLAAKEELATEALRTAGPAAQRIYGELVRNPVFDTLDARTKKAKGKVDYVFEVNHGGDARTAREARHVLSDGQMTSAALSLFFALADTAGHALDVLFVDDPTQNLDLDAKVAMAKVVTRLGRERQVIVATHDEDFTSELESAGFFDVAMVHRFTEWDGAPRVDVRSPVEDAA